MKKKKNGEWRLETTYGSNKVELSILYNGKKRAICSFTEKEDIEDFIDSLRHHYTNGFLFDKNGN